MKWVWKIFLKYSYKAFVQINFLVISTMKSKTKDSVMLEFIRSVSELRKYILFIRKIIIFIQTIFLKIMFVIYCICELHKIVVCPNTKYLLKVSIFLCHFA